MIYLFVKKEGKNYKSKITTVDLRCVHFEKRFCCNVGLLKSPTARQHWFKLTDIESKR